MVELELAGLAEPVLANYLTSLGLFRALATQLDSAAELRFHRDGTPILSSTVLSSADGWLDWMMQSWQPAVIASPWNSGAGFHGSSRAVPCSDGIKRNGVELLLHTTDARLTGYRDALSWLQEMNERVCYGDADGASKEQLLAQLRNEGPEALLPWLDAVAVVEASMKQGTPSLEARFPSLLGSGGNDGRLDFGNNYMIHLCRLLPFEGNAMKLTKGNANQARRLLGAVLGEPARDMVKDSAGQFAPASRGAPNGDSGVNSFSAAQMVNPWVFVMGLTGALLFGGAATRRLGSHGQPRAAFPFHADRVDAGYGSATAEKGRDELWLPFWRNPATYREVRQLFGEARAQVGRRRARNGLDYARALGGLGAARGLAGFHRFAIVERAGQSNIAIHTGAYASASAAAAPLDRLRPLDRYLEAYRRLASGKNSPPRFGRAWHRLEEAILQLARLPSEERQLHLLGAMGGLRREEARGLPDGSKLPRLHIDDSNWLTGLGRLPGAELRIAAAVACLDHDAPLAPLSAYLWRGDRARPLAEDAPRLSFDPLLSGILADRLRAFRSAPAERATGSPAVRSALPSGGVSSVSGDDLITAMSGGFDAELALDLLWVLSSFKGGSVDQAVWQARSEQTSKPTSTPLTLSRLWMLCRIVTEGVVRKVPGEEQAVPVRPPSNLLQSLRSNASSALARSLAQSLTAAGTPIRPGMADHQHAGLLPISSKLEQRERLCALLAVPLPYSLLNSFSQQLLVAPTVE